MHAMPCAQPGAAAGRGGRPRAAHAGTTLVGSLVALAIAGLLLALAGPGYRAWIADERLMNHARLLAGSMQLARSEAIRRGHRVNLCKSADGRQCADTGGWDQGFLLHADSEATGEVADAQAVLRYEPPVRDVRVTANRPVADYVSYTGLGQARMLNGALQMGTLTVCSKGRRAVDIVLVASGRVRIARTTTICP